MATMNIRITRYYHIGIDPGLDGATVLVDIAARELIWHALHQDVERNKEHYLSPDSLKALLKPIRTFTGQSSVVSSLAFMESAQVLGGNNNGRLVGINWGIVWSIIVDMGYDVLEIHPTSWKTRMVDKSLRARELSNAQRKQSSCIAAARLGYTVPFAKSHSKHPHDGVADAILIAHYGAQKLLSGVAEEDEVKRWWNKESEQ